MPTSFLDTHNKIEKTFIPLFPHTRTSWFILHFLYQYKKLHRKEPNPLAIPPSWIYNNPNTGISSNKIQLLRFTFSIQSFNRLSMTLHFRDFYLAEINTFS